MGTKIGHNTSGNESPVKGDIDVKINDSNRPKKMPSWVYWTWLISIVSLGFSIAAIFSCYSIKWNVEVVSTAIILTFVGVLATFVVISNYVQVKDIERKFDDKIRGVNSDFSLRMDRVNKIANEGDVKMLEYEIRVNKIANENDVKILEYKILLHYYTLEGLVDYNSRNYTSSLLNCIKALNSLNLLNTLTQYSFPNSAYYIKRLSAEDIQTKIQISEDEKNAYVKIANEYRGEVRSELIEFINNLSIKK
jgi:hypothetical protein